MVTVKCIFLPAIGGTGLSEDERLIRFIGHPGELKALLQGGLSLTKVGDFLDKGEAAGTTADDQWVTNFFGSLSNFKRKQIEAQRQAILSNAHVSCWHRLSQNSDLPKLAEEYTPDDFKCAVTTTNRRVLSSIPTPDGTPIWLNFFKVRYIKSENNTLQDEFKGEFPRCDYPALEFKRAKYDYEQEARFVMHDNSALNVVFFGQRLLAIDRPKHCYAAIDSNTFIENIYLLNDFSLTQAESLLAELNYQPCITLCTAIELKDLCLTNTVGCGDNRIVRD